MLTSYNKGIALGVKMTKACEMVTAAEWLSKQGYSTKHADVVRFGGLLARVYVQTTGEMPRRINSKGKNGKYTSRAYGYSQDCIDLFDTAFDLFTESMTFSCVRSGECVYPV